MPTWQLASQRELPEIIRCLLVLDSFCSYLAQSFEAPVFQLSQPEV